MELLKCHFLSRYELTLKKVVKIYALLNPRRTNARKVLKPPLKTAGPISRKAAIALSGWVKYYYLEKI